MRWPQEHISVRRNFTALVSVLAIATTLLLASVSLHFMSERSRQARFEQYHARTLSLLGDSQASIVTLERLHPTSEGPVGIPRAAESAAYSLERSVEFIGEIQDRFAEPALAGSVERVKTRCDRYLSSLRDQDLVAAQERLGSLELSLRQLDRLHTARLDTHLAELQSGLSTRSRSMLLGVTVLVLLTALIVRRLFLAMRAQLSLQVKTEHALAESREDLVQAQKLDALGSLVGGVAHDFNNILTAILGNAEILRMRLDPADPSVDELTAICDAGSRAGALTRQLLLFSRKGPVQRRTVDLNLLIRDLMPMLKRLVRADVELDLVLPDETGFVLMDSTQLEQVVINLVVNAHDAMPDGGVLTIRTDRVELGAGRAEALGLTPGTYAHACFTDSGQGMSPETVRRALEPFFTTKEPGQGTGLGLSSVHGIVTRGEGQIRIDSELGRGTSVHFYLPSCEPEVEEGVVPEEVEVAGGGETLLLVEDETPIREMAEKMLSNAGYEVVTAANATQALRLYEERPAGVDLVLTDVVMPGMRGPELVRRLRAQNPELRAIYISGYAGDQVLDATLRGESHFLRKPFRLQQLLQAVRHGLDDVAVVSDGHYRLELHE